jgi:hypothetical protein
MIQEADAQATHPPAKQIAADHNRRYGRSIAEGKVPRATEKIVRNIRAALRKSSNGDSRQR